MSNTPFLQPVPREMVFNLLQYKLKEVQNREIEHLDFEYCVVSYLNDWLRCKEGTKRYIKEQAAYARMWGWSKGWVHKHWSEIEKEAERQKTFYESDRRERTVNAPYTHRERFKDRRERKTRILAQKHKGRERTVNAPYTHRERTVNTYIEEPLDHRVKKVKDNDDDRGGENFENTDLSFLDPDDKENYAPLILDTLSRYRDRTAADAAFYNIFPRSKSGIRIRPWLTTQIGKYGYVKVIAALVITADRASEPSTKFALKVLENFGNPRASPERPQANIRHINEAKQKRAVNDLSDYTEQKYGNIVEY